MLAGIILLLMVVASQGKSTLNYINIFSEIFVVYLHVGSFTAFGILSSIILIALGVIGILSTLKNKKIILFATICLVFSFLRGYNILNRLIVSEEERNRHQH